MNIEELAIKHGALLYSPDFDRSRGFERPDEYTFEEDKLQAFADEYAATVSREPFGYVMQPAFDKNIKRSTICQTKHGSYQIPVFTAPQQSPIPQSSLELFAKIRQQGDEITELKIKCTALESELVNLKGLV